jgi:hypothetical protein
MATAVLSQRASLTRKIARTRGVVSPCDDLWNEGGLERLSLRALDVRNGRAKLVNQCHTPRSAVDSFTSTRAPHDRIQFVHLHPPHCGAVVLRWSHRACENGRRVGEPPAHPSDWSFAHVTPRAPQRLHRSRTRANRSAVTHCPFCGPSSAKSSRILRGRPAEQAVELSGSENLRRERGASRNSDPTQTRRAATKLSI